MKKTIRIVSAVLLSALAVVLLHYARRALVCDSFIVKGVSMEPVLHDGDRVWVNKLSMGARIYADFDFSSPRLVSFRLPGLSKVRAGDLVVANYPYARSKDSISFRINCVYLKRCYGAPGDSVRIVDGYYVDSRGGGIGDLTMQRELSETPDSILLGKGVVVKAFQMNKTLGWTIRNFGPLYVPRKGDTIDIGIGNYRTWRREILFETGKRLKEKDGKIFLGDRLITCYTFSGDWYFLGGDNVLDSRDSRYFGLFPESYVVGAVWRKKNW